MPLNISGSILSPNEVREYEYNSIIRSGLVLHLDARIFNTVSGTTWFDFSGNGNHGTLTNGPTFSSDNGGSIVFDGNDDAISLGTSVPPSGNISVFAWIYPTSFNSTWGIIMTKWLPSGSDFHWALKSNLNNGTNIRQNLYTTSNSDIYGNSVFSVNNWYYVGFTLINGGTLTFYTNGNSDGTSANVSRTVQSSTLLIGDNRASSYGLIGRIPQVQIYSRALTATEILHNYNLTKHRYGL